MTRRTRRLVAALAVTAAAALALPLAAAARSTSADRTAVLAKKGIARAVRSGWIKPADADRYRAAVYLAQRGVRFLPPLRARVLDDQLAQVANLWDSYTAPRALALFSQLEENVSYLNTHRIPDKQVDVTGPDGVVYRWFAGQGLEFHPLADFAQLNNLAAAKNIDGTRQLADALLARAVPRRGTLLWEYPFRFAGGPAPWVSGMAQAVAAQSLARAGALLGDASLAAAAKQAYAAIPGKLDFHVSTGPWIRLYSYNRVIVLNAQLQAILSLREYGQTTGDPGPQTLAANMLTAARGLFGRFDTGDWSRYNLGGAYASWSYQVFVTKLLGKLAAKTQDPFWQDAAARFTNYTYQPPKVTQEPPSAPIVAYPVPLDGWLDTVSIPLTLSKRASVIMAVAGKVLSWGKLGPGAHVLTWKPTADVQPGTYNVTVRAVDFAGHKSTAHLAPVTIAWDTGPPPLQAQVDTTTNTLTWQADEPGTPWLELKLELSDPTGVQPSVVVDLGRQPTSGSLALAIPPGTWYSALDATNSAGQTAKVFLPALTAGGTPAPTTGGVPPPPPPSP